MTIAFTKQTALDAEHRVIAICVLFPKSIDLVTAADDDFLDPRWRACMRTLRELYSQHGENLDSLVLEDALLLKLKHQGIDWVTLPDLINLDATPQLIGTYSEIVREEACKRRIKLGLGLALDSLQQGTTASEALTMASQAIREATIGQPDAALSIGDIVKGRYLELAETADKITNGDASATGISTGIKRLDAVLGGIQSGIVTLLAARPAMGKSAMALNLANHASKIGCGVHKFSLEDTRSAYADRVISMGSGVSSKSIRSCQLNRGELQAMSDAGDRIRERTNWIVDDRSALTAEEIVRCVRRNAEANGTRLVIVDYIQLLKGEQRQGQREMLSEAINCFGDAAKSDDMAYLVLSQLNRSLESRDDKRPLLSDLKECGTLEERAKAVIMLYRPEVYGEKFARDQYKGSDLNVHVGEPIPESVMEILIRKNSNGQTGTVLATWRPERMVIS